MDLPIFDLNGGIPWLWCTDEAIDFLRKVDSEMVSHFLLDCPNFREHFDSLWANLTVRVTMYNPTDGRQISEIIAKLDHHQKVLLHLRCLPLLITLFIITAVGKIFKLCSERLRELEAL